MDRDRGFGSEEARLDVVVRQKGYFFWLIGVGEGK